MRISDIGIMELSGMEFHSFHGCLESERREGNLFTVDLKAQFRIIESASSDNLADTVDYSELYDIIRAEMDKPSNLLENVAARICKSVSVHFPQLLSIEITVSKQNPPVDGVCKWSRITVTATR